MHINGEPVLYPDTLVGRWADLLIGCVTRTKFPPVPEKRWAGLDWPEDGAESMCGIYRLWLMVQMIVTAVKIDSVPGDFVEAGTWRGGASIVATGILEALEATAQVWVADSFKGLPPPEPDRYPADLNDPHHTFENLRVDLPTVEANFERYGLLTPRVHFLEGWFEDTLPGPIERISVLRMDGDMYSSTIQTLEALEPLVSPGGWIYCDDYGWCGNNCQQAVDDYRRDHGITAELFRGVHTYSAAWWQKP